MKLTKEEKEKQKAEEERLVLICDSIIDKFGPTKIVGNVVNWREGNQDRFLQAVQAKYAIGLSRLLAEGK